MKIDDFRYAECTLFRLPPIDYSGIDRIIGSVLVKAWHERSSVDDAINSILGNNSVVDKLAAQIAGNLDFQKKNAMQQISNTEQAKLQEYDAAKKQKTEVLESTLGSDVLQKQEYANQAEAELAQQHHAYSAAQASLEEMRARVRQKLHQVGGKEGFELLLKINDALKEEPLKEGEKEKIYEYPEEDISKALHAATQKRIIDPLKHPIEAAERTPRYAKPKTNIAYGFFKKVWKALNYKLW